MSPPKESDTDGSRHEENAVTWREMGDTTDREGPEPHAQTRAPGSAPPTPADFERLLAELPVAKLRIDADGIITHSEGKGLNAAGLHSGDAIGMPIWPEHWGVDDHDLMDTQISRALDGGQAQFMIASQRADGTPWAYHIMFSHDHANREGALGVAIDVTELHEAERAAEELSERFHMMAENSPDVVFRQMFKPEPHYAYMNPAVEAQTGYSPAEFYANPMLFNELIAAPEEQDLAGDVMETQETDITLERVIHIIKKDGSDGWIRMQGRWVTDASGDICGLDGFCHEITNEVNERARLEFELTHDPLTGLANQRGFMEQAATALADDAAGDTVAVFYIDIDDFQSVNVRYGHEIGNDFLRAFARKLCDLAPEPAFVARAAGDEFMVMFPKLDAPESPTSLADKISRALRDPLDFAGYRTTTSASLGVAISTRDDGNDGNGGNGSATSLVRQAQIAMYVAKQREPGGFTVYDDGLQLGRGARETAAAELGRAIEREQLRVHYQPQFELVADSDASEQLEARVFAIEALARWEHPERGLLPPSDFIPLAEETGQIVELGRWVLRRALNDCASLSEAFGRQLTMHVNLSARQFRDPAMATDVADMLTSSGITPAQLCLEVTETTAMEDVESSLATLGELSELGVRVSIDDFGTGYSSLASLQRFPVDILKIDRSFVRDLGHDPGARAIIETILSLAATLGLDTIAEGVETEEQMAALRELGCHRAQGYLFAYPQPAQMLLTAISGA